MIISKVLKSTFVLSDSIIALSISEIELQMGLKIGKKILVSVKLKGGGVKTAHDVGFK